MREFLDALVGDASDCTCETRAAGDRLRVDADGCPGRGDLETAPACRETVVAALGRCDATTVVTSADGTERRYEGRAAALFAAAARFRTRLADDALAERAGYDPLAAAREAAGRAGPVADAAATSGLAAVADDLSDYDALRPFVGPSVARSLVVPSPPPDGRLVETRRLPTGAAVRLYERPERPLRTYHLEPPGAALSSGERATLAAARDHLAAGSAGTGPDAPTRAVRLAGGDADGDLGAILNKHTRGYGVLEDLFADEAVSDVFATAPAAETNLRVRADGEVCRTNVRLTDGGATALASRLRRESGRAFSRADPTLDAVATDVGVADRVRAAGVTDPVSDGLGFAFRAHSGAAWTLPGLVENGTLPSWAAGLLSVAVERSAALLIAGPRGAGKTTLLGALLWELAAATRVVVIEDTPELPVEPLQERGRDVQALVTDPGESSGVSPATALRTALRLGEGALVVGEVRGEEARVLYEAMRVGANGSAVLGTVHGDGARAVRERVVTDLGVAETAFDATDAVVTLASQATGTGQKRRLAAIEEVDAGSAAALYADGDRTALADRGDSTLLASLAAPGETYRDVLDAVDDREQVLTGLADAGRTEPAAVVDAHAARRA